MNPIRLFRSFSFPVLLFCGAAWQCSRGLAQPAGQLVLHQDDVAFVVQYGGRSGSPGIPSWKIVVRRDDAGNIADLRVPADSPNKLSSNRPVTTILSGAGAEAKGNLGKGRDAFGTTRADVFQVVENGPGKIVVRTTGQSPNNQIEQSFTYTFTPAGVRIEAAILALMDLTSVGLWPPWDYREVAESHLKAVPIRTQGSATWASLPSSGHDRLQNMPAGVRYPVEIELRLKRPAPTYVKIFYDQKFADSPERIGHNTKTVPPEAPTAFIKNFAMTKGHGMKRGERTGIVYRYEFETR